MSQFFYLLREILEIAVQVFIVSGVVERRQGFYWLSLLFILSGAGLSIIAFPPDTFITGLTIRASFLFYIYCLALTLINPSESIVVLIIPFFFFINTFQLCTVFIESLNIHGSVLYLYLIISALAVAVPLWLLLRQRFNLREFMNRQELLLFITTFNILTGGSSDFLKAEVIPSMQRGLRFFLEDIVRNLEGSLLIPSKDNIRHPAGDLMEFLTSDRFSMALTAIMVLVPPVIVFVRLLLSPEPEAGDSPKRASIRKTIALYRAELLRRGTPIFLSFITLLVMLHGANLNLNPSYEPQPVSLIPEGGILSIPLSDRTGDISDMKLRKYAFIHEGVPYRIAVMMRPDGEVIACLDACEICPPRGYIQRGKYLICKYCNTPVPAESFGREGGCNPIPLPFKVEKDNIIIRVQDIVEASKRAGSKFKGRH